MPVAATHLLLEMSRPTAQACLSGLWQGLALTLAVAVSLRLFVRASAAVRSAIWVLAFALVIALPLLQLRTSAVQQLNPPSAVVHLGGSWALVIAFVWALLTILRTVQLASQAIRLRRIWRNASPVMIDPTVRVLLQNGRRAAVLCTSADVDAPSVIGFFSPRLLIPEGLYAELTHSELRQIILHECEHLRRGDDWINLLQKIGLALFPLNLALLWVDRRLGLERELACDARVVAWTSAPFDYAKCLTRLAEHGTRRRKVALSLSAWSRQSELARRVCSLLRPIHRMSPVSATASIVLLGFGLAVSAAMMARAPRLITFTNPAAEPVEEAITTTQTPTSAMPVVYRQSAQPHVTLLKAILPSTVPPSKAPRALGIPKPANRQRLRVGAGSVSSETLRGQPRVMLTTATLRRSEGQDRHGRREVPRRAYALSTEFTYSYAAVPFGDGWLIVQL